MTMDKERVKQIRESLGLTQLEFAELLGVTTRSVSSWENGGTIARSKEIAMERLVLMPHNSFGGGNANVTVAGDVTGNDAHVTTTNNTCDQSCLTALLKSQEQIDRLISVIEHITGTPYNK